jgi:hypothetical protein
MRKVIANEWMTLDGVVQAPSYADEDVTGGFQHGGWHPRYFDDLSMAWVLAEPLNAMPKHVASKTLAEPLGWRNSTLLRRQREDAVSREPEPGMAEQADDTLLLLFLCCHPALSPASAIALTLRAVGGLTWREAAGNRSGGCGV